MMHLMLAEEGSERDLRRSDWRAETKFDGTRIAIQSDGNQHVQITNRKGEDYHGRLPEVEADARTLPQCVIDAEAVVYRNGVSYFTGSQRRCSTQDRTKTLRLMLQFPIVAECFDILSLDGSDTTFIPYLGRKGILQGILKQREHKCLRYVEDTEDLVWAYQRAVTRGEEGVMLKQANSPYQHVRSRYWLKVKKIRTLTGRVIGYTAGEGWRSAFFGALILADEQGRYIGKVGGGFNDADLERVRLALIRAKRDGLRRIREVDEPYTPIETDLKVEAVYQQLTDNGIMRFPRFLRVVEAN